MQALVGGVRFFLGVHIGSTLNDVDACGLYDSVWGFGKVRGRGLGGLGMGGGGKEVGLDYDNVANHRNTDNRPPPTHTHPPTPTPNSNPNPRTHPFLASVLLFSLPTPGSR